MRVPTDDQSPLPCGLASRLLPCDAAQLTAPDRRPRLDPGEGKLPRLPVTFPEETYEWLREAAFRRRMKMSKLVRQAVTEFRQREEPQLGLPIPPGEGRIR